MRIQFQIMLFAIFLNISLLFVASTGFFSNTFYGDPFTRTDYGGYDIDNPDSLPPPEEVFTQLIYNSVTGEVGSILGYELTFGGLMAGIVAISIAVGIATKATNGIALGLVGLMFSVMWANSRGILNELTKGLDSSVNYLVLMFMLGVLISFVILIFDAASGQRSTK